MLRLSFKASVLATALAVLPLGANAAGLGRITVLSALGQPLRAEVELTASREELSSLSAKLASHDAFKQAGIEFSPALSGIKLVIDKRTGGQPVIRMTTDRPVNDPFLDLLIELNWTAGRLVREYTFLLDPAPEALARKPVAAPVAKRDAAAQPSPVSAPKQPEVRATAPMDDKLLAKKPEEAKPAGDAQGREVKKGEYLRKIAAESRYDGVSLDQMLVAIFRSNKDAFIGNNMHRLKAGKILNIPDRDAVAAVEARDARKTISVHTADFNAYRQKLASAAAGAEAPKEDVAKQVATGKIGAKVEDKAPAPAEAKDQLKVSKAETAKDTRAAQGKIAALEEDLVAKDRALKEAQSRQADLEKNVKKLQELVELKSQGMAELQKQAAAKAAPPPVVEVKKPEAPVPAAPIKAPETSPAVVPAPTAAEKPAEKPAEPAKSVEVAPAKSAEVEKPAEAAKPAEPPKPAEAPKPAPKKTSAPPPPPEPDFLDELMDNPAILGGGVLVLGLLGFIAYRQRRKKQEQEGGEAPPTTTANLTANSVFGATGGQSVDTTGSSMATDFSQASISAIDADEGVDPVAEADVYMAYGRDAQAEEILLDALKTDPTRTAIHVKLLEIYAGRKNNKQFETLASDLYAQTGGVGGDWEKAAAMGLKLDPANPLYGGGAAGDKQSVHTDTTIIVPAGEKQLRDTWTMPGELSQISEAVEKGAATVILEKPVEAAVEAPAAVPALDFDLDLGSPAAPAAKAPSSQAPAPAKTEASAGLDFDLGLDFKPPENKPTVYNAEATMIMDVAKSAQTPAADLALDIKLDEPAAASTAVEGLHFDLDLGAPATAAAPASAEVVDLEKTIAGGSALDFDFNIGAPPAAKPVPQTAPDMDIGSISLDLGETAAAEPAAGDEVATKLELAKAYEEMGDKEGARELLAEVTKEGSAEQQAKAQSLLAKLS
ncbi:MAG: FimV family protein [Rhodocyclales bacterium]|nr:FimV family protein [Rhodocyclales bacterium]